tara:strand:+ start:619 stop:1485 length:867 start_codon:yes stop_codon:yes gene_type:complete
MTEEELPKKFCEVFGKKISYYESGEGDPIVFLHGNPTSSYLWRNIIPHLEKKGRCLAPDLIGMGDSDKLDDSGPTSYSFFEHRKFLDELLIKKNIKENVTFVLHDWGSALGFDWAYRHQNAIKGIAYMEAITATYKWDDWPEQSQKVFKGFRSEAGEEMILQKNIFVEKVLPGSIMRDLSEKEMDVYRKPFKKAGEDRRPTLSWPRNIPIEGSPEEVHSLVEQYSKWIKNTPFPKLFINAKPGAILTGRHREYCRTWNNQKEVTVKGIHFIQEDSPTLIGEKIASWIP